MNDRTKDYVFVSYSHGDDIKPILQEFERRGYNLVYDEVMRYGEEWDLAARRYIQNSKCRGVLSFLSRKSLCSKPVLIETEYAAKFKKDIFAVLMEHRVLTEIYEQLAPTLDENKLYLLDSMMENFPPEQLYAFFDSIDWAKAEATFATWGFHPEKKSEYEGIVQVAYSADMKDEKGRLSKQQEGYYELDMQALDEAMADMKEEGLVVLDIGCGNGSVTFSRFAEKPRIKKVIGVDYHKRSIEEAREKAKAYGDKFAFAVVDLSADTVLEDLRAVMAEEGVEKIDLIFAALVLHHLPNPNLLLLKLYDIFDDYGKIVVRGSDDGGKLCYPESQLMIDIFERYGRLVNNSDRENGRKLFSQLYRAGYDNVRMMYKVSDHCGKDEDFKEMLFGLAFGFRLNRIDALLEKNPDNEFIKKERVWMAEALEKLKKAFLSPDFWYSVTSYIAIAEVRGKE